MMEDERCIMGKGQNQLCFNTLAGAVDVLECHQFQKNSTSSYHAIHVCAGT